MNEQQPVKRPLPSRPKQSASLYARSLLEASLDPLVTISHQGKITDVNKATEQVTGVSRERLIGSDFSDYFTEPARARAGYQKVIQEGMVKDYPLTIRHVSGNTTHVLYHATVYTNKDGVVQGVFAAARDITEREAAQKRQDVIHSLTQLFARKNSRKEYLSSAVEVIRNWSGCRCVGIRVVDAEDCIPFEACVGFDAEFQKIESRLSLKKDACLCIRAIAHRPDEQDRRVMTPGGSFSCNDTQAFAQTLKPEHQSLYRGTCFQRGFRSLAVIPIQYREQILGAIHLADERTGRVSSGNTEFIESLAPLIGEALQRFNAETELARSHEHLEELVIQRTKELQKAAEELARSNKDLEQFAYVASHDLQEPLRAVAGFVGLLKHEYWKQLDGKALEYIDMASDGAKRMQILIEDLLKYSRVGTQGGVFKTIDANLALSEATANLQNAIQESGAIIHSDPLPFVYADITQLTQLLQNLIGNAIKFRGLKKPEIKIGAIRIIAEKKSMPESQPKNEGQELDIPSAIPDSQHSAEDAWLFTVQDNGIGIEPQYYERIFMIFQRLHSRTRYQGTGIGLAVCKRIVERHSGRIWVESQPGEGSKFYFTISDKRG